MAAKSDLPLSSTFKDAVGMSEVRLSLDMKLEDNCGTGKAAEALLSKSRRGENIEVYQREGNNTTEKPLSGRKYQREGNNYNGETVVRPDHLNSSAAGGRLHINIIKYSGQMLHADILSLAGLRVDGRKAEELRSIRFKVGAGHYPSSSGSCYVEHGLNKVLVLVYGPQESSRRNMEVQMTEKGRITCQVETAPYSGVERKVRKPGDRKSVELENTIKQTFEAVVHLELYPQSDISFIVHILASDGSLECAVLNACTMALMDAGISMSDMIVACSVGSVKQRICLDLSQV